MLHLALQSPQQTRIKNNNANHTMRLALLSLST